MPFGIDDATFGSLVQGAGSLLGGMFGSDAAGDAARQQQEAIQGALQVQARNAEEGKAALAPYQTTGTLANRRLRQLLGLGGAPSAGNSYQNILDAKMAQYRQAFRPEEDNTTAAQAARSQIYRDAQEEYAGQGDSNAGDYGSLTRNFSAADLNADPVYQSGLQFGLDQGTKAINERAIANGGYDSGATLKALTRFGNDYGSTKANESFARNMTQRQNTYNMLSGASGAGQNAAVGAGGLGMQGAAATGNLLTDYGNAGAAGRVGSANAWSNAFGGVGSAIQGYQNSNILNALMRNRNGGGAGGYSTPPYFGLNGGAFNPEN